MSGQNPFLDLHVKRRGTVVSALTKHEGGKWTYRGMCTWECNDGRTVSRCALMGGHTGDEYTGSAYYLYEQCKGGRRLDYL